MAAPAYSALLQVVAHHPAYLYAVIIPFCSGFGMSVYRSPLLEVTEDAYSPVRTFLEEHDHDLVWRDTVVDESMMFGEAQHSVYMMKEKT